MARIDPLGEAELAPFADLLAGIEARMGFVPNSMKTMARRPALLKGFMALAMGVIGPGCSLPPELQQMVAHIASAASGCRYCQAHTAHMAVHAGADPAKIADVWAHETSPRFTPAEKAALALAQAAAEQPNRAGPAHFEAARAHFGDDQIVEIVGIVAFFGFLNRWNDTMGTTLEDSPLAFAEAHLGGLGWTVGKHGG